MSRRRPLRFPLPSGGLALALAAVVTVALTLALAGPSAAAVHSAAAPAAETGPDPGRFDYLQAAAHGRTRSRAWWDRHRGWYRERLGDHGKYPLATLWGAFPLFEATSALAIADPSGPRRAAVRTFAKGAARYWNANLRPVPGFAPYPGDRSPKDRTWFDDNGWWGIAFYDAYRATGNASYLGYSKRALTFIDKAGWDRRRGGLWWDTKHTHKAGESLAGGTLLAASLYHETHAARYLSIAKRYIAWADEEFRGADGLYDRSEDDETPMPYVQGPMFAAFALICASTGDQSYCDRAEQLATRSTKRFPRLSMGPQYDAIYVRCLLELYRMHHNPRWYEIAEAEAERAIENGRAANGLYLRNWDGGSPQAIGTRPNMLQTHAATTSVIAWMAAADPPASP
jgi:uncharacterized protein YyaL (SSP411 family)